MDKQESFLRNLSFLHIPNESGTASFGCDQDWFSTAWKRQAGCGPNAASNMLLYLQAGGRIHLNFGISGKTEIKALMEAVWRHVTPGLLGVHTIRRFAKGLHAFSVQHGVDLSCELLEVPRKRKNRPSVEEAARFIAEGLDRDCPVAFLNLHNGSVAPLDAWHWVTVISLSHDESGNPVLGIYDGDKAFDANLSDWLASSAAGGGFVRLGAPLPASRF